MSVWPEVDCDPAIWIRVPGVWDEHTWPDHRDWAWDLAEACWGDFDLEPREYEVDNLAMTLAMFAEKLQSDRLPAQHFFLHLPDPRMMPLQVCLGIYELEGEREQVLRGLANADDPDAVEPPLVEPFATEHLGEGLRSLRYRPFEPGPDSYVDAGALYASLNYAWRVNEQDTDVRLFSSCPDLARIIQSIDDIDALAQTIRIIPNPADTDTTCR